MAGETSAAMVIRVGRKGCGIECRTMQLGALTRLLNSTSLLYHSVEKDYQALSVGELLKQLETAVCPTWYGMFVQKQEPYNSFNQYNNKKLTHNPHECPAPGNSFYVAISSIIAEVNGALRGLSITNYAKSATESK